MNNKASTLVTVLIISVVVLVIGLGIVLFFLFSPSEDVGGEDIGGDDLDGDGGSQVVCVENWNCGDWDDCVDGEQIRECVDLNGCDSFEDKPSEVRECEVEEEDECTRNSDCEEDEFCNDDGECEVEEELIDCGLNGWDCFIDAAGTCEDARMENFASINFFGINISSGSDYILNKSDLGKCNFYTETKSYDVEYEEELVQSLLDSGLTLEEINQQEQEERDRYQEVIGKYLTCEFEENDLVSVLERWEVGNVSGGVSCTGLDIETGEWDECTLTGDYEVAENCRGTSLEL
tara:strand:+ start:163 stop:1035 length:873 start_codon:yes stop_codon:yes gene_type:complete